MAAVLVFPFACTSTPKAAGRSQIAGTYDLTTVDGHAIPFAPMHGGRQAPLVVSGTLTLNADHTFDSSMSYGNASGVTWSKDFEGTYSGQSGQYVLKWEGAGKTSVKIDGATLTMNNEGMLFIYRKKA
jgi:hypothetical protein